MRSDNLNYKGHHTHQDCPLSPICSGCYSDQHYWSKCPHRCEHCGATRHKIDYCIDFNPGTGEGGEASWLLEDAPEKLALPKTFKTNLADIQAARCRPLVQNGHIGFPRVLPTGSKGSSAASAQDLWSLKGSFFLGFFSLLVLENCATPNEKRRRLLYR